MPTPSLLIVPSRWKTGNPGKLYSQIPTNGNGDFNVTGVITGATNAGTRVNNLGYIEPITTSGTPRLDYYTSSGLPGCPALLVEPAATNLALQSEDFLTTWSPTNITVTTGSTAAFTAPDGSTDADLLTSISSMACNVYQNISFASGTYTISVFGKAGSSSILSIGNISRPTRGAWFNLAAGAVTGTVNGGTASMQDYGNGWYRCIYTSSGMVSGTNTLIVSLSDAANQTTATSGTNIYVWGAQLETGSVATSYIPTTTGSVTRNADVISVSGAVSGSIGQASGTIYAEVDIRNAFAGTFISLDIGSGADFLIIGRTSGLAVIVQLRRSNGSVVTIITSSAVALGVHKIALGYTNGDYALYIDGVSAGTSTNSTDYPSAALTRCGLAVTSYNIFNDRIRAAALYTTRLTNAELMLLTMPGNNTYLPQAVWDNYLSRTGNAEVPDCLYTRHADLLDV